MRSAIKKYIGGVPFYYSNSGNWVNSLSNPDLYWKTEAEANLVAKHAAQNNLGPVEIIRFRH